MTSSSCRSRLPGGRFAGLSIWRQAGAFNADKIYLQHANRSASADYVSIFGRHVVVDLAWTCACQGTGDACATGVDHHVRGTHAPLPVQLVCNGVMSRAHTPCTTYLWANASRADNRRHFDRRADDDAACRWSPVEHVFFAHPDCAHARMQTAAQLSHAPRLPYHLQYSLVMLGALLCRRL